MKDRSIGILLMLMFGISGMVAILLGWLLPGMTGQRLAATLVGSMGIAIAVINGLRLRRETANSEHVMPLKAEIESKP